MAHSIDRTIHYVHSFMIERSMIFYYSATFSRPWNVRDCSFAANLSPSRRRDKSQWEHDTGGLFMCNWFLLWGEQKNGKGILFYMCLPNSVKRQTLIKNRSDRCKNGEKGTDGELKLMVFTASFCTPRTWRATHNFDSAIKIFLPIVLILAWPLRVTCRHAPHTLASRAFEELYLSTWTETLDR